MKDLEMKRVKVVCTTAANGLAVSAAATGEQGVVHTVYPEHEWPVCVVFGDGYIECFKEEDLRYLNNRRVVL